MQAQSSRTPEINFNPAEQVTPVVVKIGGGDMDVDTEPNPNFIIDSSYMPFTDKSGEHKDDTWHEALSTKTGRIHELTLDDGDLQTLYCKVLPQSDAITYLELTYQTATGTEVLELFEEPAPGEKYQLKVKSHIVSFKIIEPGREGWKVSGADFPSKPVSLIFKQKPNGGGDEIVTFQYSFNRSNMSFSLIYHVDPSQ